MWRPATAPFQSTRHERSTGWSEGGVWLRRSGLLRRRPARLRQVRRRFRLEMRRGARRAGGVRHVSMSAALGEEGTTNFRRWNAGMRPVSSLSSVESAEVSAENGGGISPPRLCQAPSSAISSSRLPRPADYWSPKKFPARCWPARLQSACPWCARPRLRGSHARFSR